MVKLRIWILILSLCILVSLLCGECLALPLNVKDVVLCKLPTETMQEFVKCQKYDIYYQTPLYRFDREQEGYIPIGDSVAPPNLDLELARFNIHLNFDHMWHLNIGFNK